MFIIRWSTFILFFLLVNFLSAQELDPRYHEKKTVPFGVIEAIESEYLSEKRVLNIYLPEGYHPDSAKRYEVIYLLDGSAHEDYPHIAGLVQFGHMYELLPPSIVVGIANVDRKRDFTSPSTDSLDIKYLPQSGGSGKFMDFIEKELQPFVQNSFKTNGKKTIIGQSLGGLLATEILLKRPHLFDTYMIISPSLWWNQQGMIPELEAYFKENQELSKTVYVSLGKEHPVMQEVADKLVEAIRMGKNKKIRLIYKPMPEENHATILHKAIYEAFLVLYPKKEE